MPMRRSLPKTALCLVPPALLAAALLCVGRVRLAGLEQGRDGYEGKVVLINEVCAKNLSINVEGETGIDWIELYNPTEMDLDLSGDTLRSRADGGDGWQLPAGTVLGGGEYLILLADGTDTGLHTSFKLSGDGDTLRLTDADGALLDSLTYPELAYDVTYGRRRLDGASAGLFATASPGAANPTDYWQREIATAALGEVGFSQSGGFYGDTVCLQLTSDDPDALILYTLDGSEPDMDSNFYTAPLTLESRAGEKNRYVSQPSTLDAGYWLKNYALSYAAEPVAKATTVTARLYKDGALGECVSAETYWVGQEPYTLPVVSVTAEAGNLFGRYGIYQPGSTYFTLRKFGMAGNYGNYLAENPVEARIEIFAADGTALLRDTGTVKVTGGVSRSVETLKNLQLRFDHAEAEIIPGVAGLTSLTVRGSGASSVHFGLHKDAFWNNYLFGAPEGAGLGVRYNQPAILFLEDEYWGVYTLRERIDGQYFKSHYGLSGSEVEYPEDDDANGIEAMQALATEIDALDAGSDAAYAWAAEHFDLANYCDWLIAEMYTGNLDGLYSGGNNTVLWRSRVQDTANPYADGRWRFVLNDLDATMFDADADPITPLLEGEWAADGEQPEPLNWYCVPALLFQKLWGNAAFRAEFCAAARAAMATTYAPESLFPAFDAWCETLRPELDEDIARGQVLPNALTPLADALTDSAAQEKNLTREEWEQNAAALRLYIERRADVFLAALPE